ncbi:hypothetical protein KJ786_02250 [Patescibacteria group bacterium]|nr:hypothetical protein [Patescibacteria group bacterium]
MNKYLAIIILIIALAGFNFFTSSAEAANFFVVPPVLATGQETTIILGINTENQNINAVELNLKFSNDDFLIKNINDGNSIINFWVERPKFSNEQGEVSFSGIIAGGYSDKDGGLIKIDLIANREGEKEFSVQNAKVLLNDGQGTEAKLTANSLKLSVVGAVEPSMDTKPLIIKDNDSPESFLPQVAQDPNVFDGKYFLVFTAQDKNSGIDHYEIKEKRVFEILGLKIGVAKWIEVESPYILKDQKLKRYIYVKAIDRAGNERIETLLPQTPAVWYEKYLIWSILIIIVIIVLYISRILWKR